MFGYLKLIVPQVTCACPVTLTCCHLWGPIPKVPHNPECSVLMPACLPRFAFPSLSVHVIQSSLTVSSPGGSTLKQTAFLLPSREFLCLARRGSGTEEPFCENWNSLPEGSAGWMLLNNPVFLLEPLSVSIVPQPFASSASSSTSIA